MEPQLSVQAGHMSPALPGPSPSLSWLTCDPWFCGTHALSQCPFKSQFGKSWPCQGLCLCDECVQQRGEHTLQRCSPNVPATVPTLTARPPLSPFCTFSSSPASTEPACQAAALFGDANIHELLEPQIKGGVPQPASQWTLCADGGL